MTDLEGEHQHLSTTAAAEQDFDDDVQTEEEEDGDENENNEEDADEEDRQRAAADEFRCLIVVLASCRPDVMSPRDRKALMDEAADKLRDDPRLRLLLARWKGTHSSFVHSRRRLRLSGLLLTPVAVLLVDRSSVLVVPRVPTNRFAGDAVPVAFGARR
jgi:hypothetical protein